MKMLRHDYFSNKLIRETLIEWGILTADVKVGYSKRWFWTIICGIATVFLKSLLIRGVTKGFFDKIFVVF